MKDYRSQALDNILAFYDAEYTPRRELLYRIVREFESQKIQFALGCSFSLFVRGIVDDFHDFDVLVSNKHVEKAKQIMKEVIGATLVAVGGNGYCNSDDYSHWQVSNCDVDLIAGFRVETFGHSLHVPINEEIIEFLDFEYLPYKIPVICVEPLYCLYSMMEGWQHKRRYKKLLIEEYFSYVPPSKDLLQFYLSSDDKRHSSVAPWIQRRVEEFGFFQK
ncbi:MAG: hypothetical protein IKE91_01265 [Clostridia bacterium]|nr:hypothetical protein [Clostridia bacterium]